jgi:hypothetical protein
MNERPRVYVIVVHYGTWEDTIACLRSLELLVYRPFEVYVVDNGSARVLVDRIDGVASYPLHQLALPDNRGFASGANAGLTAALARGDGRFYWILNNDTEV